MVFAGAALSVLSVASLGSLWQQAQAQQPSPVPSKPPAAGNIVMVAPTDTIAAIQTKLNSVPAAGTLAFPANSAFNFNGRTVRGKDNVTVWADGVVTINGAPGPGTAGAFDFGGMSNWSVRGRAIGAGFFFNGSLVNATSARNFLIGNCVFNSTPSNGLDGSAIRLTNASFGQIVSCDFNTCGGNVLGMYNLDNITFDSLVMPGALSQPFGIVQGTDTNRGRNIKLINSVISGWSRGGFETGNSDDNTLGYFKDLLIDNCHFIDPKGPVKDGFGAISIVTRGQVGTRITNNYLRLGSKYGTAYSEAIEYDSKAQAATISNNLIDGFTTPFAMYDLGGVGSGNKLWNSSAHLPASIGYQILTAQPAEPAKPVRTII